MRAPPSGPLVVGFGNPLMADDGVGPAVIDRLARQPLPAGVRVEDGGSDSLQLSSLWRGEPEIWIVDAVIRGDAPGTIYRLDHDELIQVPQRHGTAHHLSLPESLRWVAISYPEMAGVRYRMWGVEPEAVEPRPGLSSAVAAVVEKLAGEIVDLLKQRRDPAVTGSPFSRH